MNAPLVPGLRALALTACLLACTAATTLAAPPDPLTRGSYAVTTADPFKAGTVNLQEPNAAGGAPGAPYTSGGSATGVTNASAATLQVRGTSYLPTGRTTPAPVIVLVHGNHQSCFSQATGGGGSAPACTVFERNDRGYGYLAENLASHGYAVFSLDQDEMMYFQDGPMGKGMHQRRLLIAALLDALHAANDAAQPVTADSTLADTLVDRLDFDRVGLMGHSRGGDVAASFIDFNRTRPAPGRRYSLRGVISLAPVDYERRAPTGVPHLAISALCDGDVSNQQGARMFERGQVVDPSDPFPRLHASIHGTNHNWFNTIWGTDPSDDAGGSTTNPNADVACGQTSTSTIRLSLGSYSRPRNPADGFGTSGSGDPALLGDQTKIGLATMNSFFRRYVGGETAFDPYETGELSATPSRRQIPDSACPTQGSGGAVAAALGGGRAGAPTVGCDEWVSMSYFPGAAERRDLIGPGSDDPLTSSAVGTALRASGFSNPFRRDGGIQPPPSKTESGLDWCNPEPDDFAPGQIGSSARPTAAKGCPLPADGALGGQGSTRENAPINHSYGLQLAAAWDDPVARDGKPATIATRIPSSLGDASGFKALALGAAVNFFDPRNPARTGEALWNPAATTQDFTIALTDADGTTATVAAGDPRYGNALHQTVGSTTPRLHVLLNQIRVPLSDFAAQGVDLTRLREVSMRFGEAGKPATGSIQLSDVRFQELVTGPRVLSTPRSLTPLDLIEQTPRTAAGPATPDVVGLSGAAKAAERSCRDRLAPTIGGLRAKRSGGVLTLRGTATDPGCAALNSVQVTLVQKAGKRCRFVNGKGRLTRPLPCSARFALVARGKSAWTLKLRAKAEGLTATVRALDEAGNVSRTRSLRA